jgi:cytidylate kinase
MIYIFGGVGKTGCSSLNQDFANQFGLRRVYAGGFMKQEAMKAGFVKEGYVLPENINDWDLDMHRIADFRKMCEETGREIDSEIEGYILREMVTSVIDGQDIVVDSKILSRVLHTELLDPLVEKASKEVGLPDPMTREELIFNSKSIWVHADLEVRAKRSLGRMGVPSMVNGETGSPCNQEFSRDMIDREAAILNERQVADRADYSRIYGMFDYPIGNEIPPSTYGTILINNCDKETSYAKVLEIMGKA